MRQPEQHSYVVIIKEINTLEKLRMLHIHLFCFDRVIGSMDSVFECIRIYTQIRYRDLLNNIIHFQAMDVLFQINKPNYISRKIVINIDIQVEKQRDAPHN